MKKTLVSEAQILAADQYLKRYRLHSRLLRLSEYERRKGIADAPWEASLSRAELFRIRQFIMSLENCDEKIFLYYYYVRGASMEECAELLGIARSSIYRLRPRALSLAALRMQADEESKINEPSHAMQIG